MNRQTAVGTCKSSQGKETLPLFWNVDCQLHQGCIGSYFSERYPLAAADFKNRRVRGGGESGRGTLYPSLMRPFLMVAIRKKIRKLPNLELLRPALFLLFTRELGRFDSVRCLAVLIEMLQHTSEFFRQSKFFFFFSAKLASFS